jgi:hypothetical protein
MPDLSVPIGAQFPHPPLQDMHLEAIAGGAHAYGTYTFTRPAPLGLFPVSAFGFLWSVDVEPLGVGILYGPVAEYEERVCQVVVHHRMLSGELINTQVVDANGDGYVLFPTFPEDVVVQVTPGFEVEFFWIVLV